MCCECQLQSKHVVKTKFNPLSSIKQHTCKLQYISCEYQKDRKYGPKDYPLHVILQQRCIYMRKRIQQKQEAITQLANVSKGYHVFLTLTCTRMWPKCKPTRHVIAAIKELNSFNEEIERYELEAIKVNQRNII